MKKTTGIILLSGILISALAALSSSDIWADMKHDMAGLLPSYMAGESAKKIDALGYPEDRDANQHLSLEAKLLYTTLLGRPVGLTSAEIAFEKLPKNLSYVGFSFAVAARQALQLPSGATSTSAAFLEEFLTGTTEAYPIKDLPKDLPQGMHADDLAMLHIYALVMSNQADSTVQLLEKHLQSKNDFTRHFVIMALRSIGTAKARELIKSRANNSDDTIMARDALGLVVPNFIEPKQYASEVAITKRFRNTMLAQAEEKNTSSILPTMLLGFVGEDAPAEQIAAERNFLMNLYKTADNALWRKYMYGYASLAFRFKVPYEHWVRMYQSDSDPLRRSFILRSMAAQYPDLFFQRALALFEKEKNGAVQLEFFSLYANLIEGGQLFGPFDAIWMPNLRYRLAYPWSKGGRKRSASALFDAWANGKIAEDTHWPVWMVDLMRAEDEAKFLLGYLRMQNRDAYSAYALRQIKDKRMLPVIRYLISVETKGDVKQATQEAFDGLENGNAGKENSCCGPSEVCLREQILDAAVHEAKLSSQSEAQHYLKNLPGTQMKLEFIDDLKRRAKVSTNGKNVKTWEYWLGCWRPEVPATK